MSDERSGARQTGAPALTLTRRQQKRARQKQQKQRQGKPRTAAATTRQAAVTQQRPGTAAPVAAPERRKVVATSGNAVATTTATRREPETRQDAETWQEQDRDRDRDHDRRPRRHDPAQGGSEPKGQREQRETRHRLSDEREEGSQAGAGRVSRRAAGAAARAGEHDETRPVAAAKAPRTVQRAVQRVSKRTRPMPAVRAPEVLDSPSASGRKYPTLARVATAQGKAEPLAAGATAQQRGDPAARGSREQRDDDRATRAAGRANAVHSVAAHAAWDEMSTEPVPTVARAVSPQVPQPPRAARQPVPTRRLRDMDAAPESERRAGTATGLRAHAARSERPERPIPLPRAELVTPVAVAHAGVAAAAAVAGAVMLLLDAPGALWPLSLTLITGVGGWLAYALAARSGARGTAATVLLASQLGILAWLLALLGPRAALLAIVPALALLALRMMGRGAAMAVAIGAFALYVVSAAVTLGAVAAPGAALDAGGAALADGLALAAGLGATLLGMLHLANSRAWSELAAQARLHEARVLRARLAQVTRQVEDDGERLEAALSRALHGGGIPPVTAGGALSPLAETVGVAAERLQTLQRDREDRLRLEGAMRAVTRAVERAWLGLPWSWPEWSGTPMDELVALLRTPRPRESREMPEVWTEETPTLLQLPALDRGMAPRSWESEPLPVYPYMAKAANGWSRPLEQPSGAARRPGRSGGQITPLPWNEWNQWPGWEGRG